MELHGGEQQLPVKYVVACALLVLGIFAALSWADHRVQINALRDSVEVAREARSMWQAKYAEASTTIQRDTLRLTKYLQRWDTVRLAIPDTAESDSVSWSAILPVIQLADSTINACRDVLRSCAEFKTTADSTVAALERERETYKNLYIATKPSRWDKAKPWVFGGIGLYLGLNAQRVAP